MKHHLTETHGHSFEIHNIVLSSQSFSLTPQPHLRSYKGGEAWPFQIHTTDLVWHWLWCPWWPRWRQTHAAGQAPGSPGQRTPHYHPSSVTIATKQTLYNLLCQLLCVRSDLCQKSFIKSCYFMNLDALNRIPHFNSWAMSSYRYVYGNRT